AQAQTTLRYKFKEGEKLNYVMEQTMVMKMNVGGKEVTVKSEQVMDLLWNIHSVDSDGTAKLTQTMQRIRMNMDLPTGQKITYDSRDKKELDDPVGRMI